MLNFNAATFDPERVNEFSKKLSTKSSSDESNYGSVTINNSKTLVGWGTLAPFVESNIVPCIYDLYDDVAIVGLDYTMGAANSNGSYDAYAVHEYYRVRQTTKNMYLLNYDRETNQIFEVNNAMPSTDKINLGIGSDMEVQLITSGKKNFTYFENVGSIWCFDSAENLFTKVFSFATEDSDNVRERYANHAIKLINVDDDGNCNFLVYGYMNRGAHEGELGISLYNYNYKEDYLVEKLFIPSDKPYELLSGSVGGVAYVNNNNAFYILINNSLYSIDLISKEIMTVADNLTKDNYKVSDDGRIVAYVTGEDIYSSDEVRVFNMETGTDHYVRGSEVDKVRPLGFIDNDFIYGFANEQDIFTENDGIQVFAMHTVKIMNEEYSVIKEYSQENIYLSDVEIANLRINLYRMTKNEDGSFSSISMDQLINHNENVEKQETTVASMNTEAKKKEVVLKLAKNAQAGESIVVRSAGQIEYLEENVLAWADDIKGADKYYVQSSGLFRGSSNTVEEAAALTGSEMGIITDDDGNIVWKKYKSSSATVKGFSLAGGSSYENVRAALESFAGSVSKKWIRMEGIAPENVLPFVSEGSPVMGKTSDGYVVIVAYDSKTISYVDGNTGVQTSVSISDANKLFAQGGNIFITYYSLNRQ